MIVPKMKGGLGNQMFQIAAGYSLAKDVNADFAINYDIPHACHQGNHPKTYKDTLYQKIPYTSYTPTQTWKEPHWHYYPLPKQEELLYEGYLQSDKHFKHNIEKIKSIFIFPDNVKNKIDNALYNFKDKHIVGIHFRCGDFKHFDNIHPICTIDYFESAVTKHFKKEHIFIICTDDIQACTNLFSTASFKYIMANSSSELEDLYLLSQCDSNIISNSSFSWWGATLGKQKQTVICPSEWFGSKGYHPYDDIYVNEWIKI